MRRIKVLLLAPLALLCGCNFGDKKVMRFLAIWTGGFTVQQVIKGADSPKDRAGYNLKGYLKILSNRQEFWIHLEGSQQGVDIKGNYKLEKDRITLKIGPATKIDDFGGIDKRNPNLKWIPSEDLQASFGRPIILDLSKDGMKLTGLITTIGPVLGKYEFTKAYKE